MKIIVIPNLLFQYIKLGGSDNSQEVNEEYSRHTIDCIICGFRMGEYIMGYLKCFKCGSEID